MPQTVTVNVVGFTWGCFKSAYSYTMDAPAPNTPRDIVEVAVRRAAGDFQTIDDFQIQQSTTRTIQQQQGYDVVRSVLVLYDWAKPKSARLFARTVAA